MKIQNISSAQSFGKTPVMVCSVRRAGNREKTRATLYQLDVSDTRDIADVRYSKTALCMLKDMMNDKYSSLPKEYFIMTDDRTGEVISCAETSNHIRVSDDKLSGKYLLVNEFNQNGGYIRPDIPMFAFFAQKSFWGRNSNIVMGTSNFEEKTLKRTGFSQAKNGEWFMNNRRYLDIIDFARKKFNFAV